MVRYQIRTTITAKRTTLSERIGSDQFLQRVYALLVSNPLLNFFNAEVGWGMNGEERYVSNGITCDVGLGKALTFPGHTVLQTADVEDTLPRSIVLFSKLNKLCLQQEGI